jgi:hypothetical protein
MTRNFLVFIFGVFLLLVFSFFFCYVSIYSDTLIAAIPALVGFIACLVIALMIGVASREEGGSLYLSFFIIAGVTAVVLVWYVARMGVLLKVW